MNEQQLLELAEEYLAQAYDKNTGTIDPLALFLFAYKLGAGDEQRTEDEKQT